MLVDSPCHLDGSVFEADLEAVIERARHAGVSYMLAIGTGANLRGLFAIEA